MLWIAAMEKGYSAPYWMTYKQALELGGQVKKGEKSTTVVYANSFTKTEENDAGEEVERPGPARPAARWQARSTASHSTTSPRPRGRAGDARSRRGPGRRDAARRRIP